LGAEPPVPAAAKTAAYLSNHPFKTAGSHLIYGIIAQSILRLQPNDPGVDYSASWNPEASAVSIERGEHKFCTAASTIREKMDLLN
jgi:hypothetical protein